MVDVRIIPNLIESLGIADARCLRVVVRDPVIAARLQELAEEGGIAGGYAAAWQAAEEKVIKERIVCGSYPGAVAWMIYTDEPPEELAARLCESAGCDEYSVDGVFYPAVQCGGKVGE